jgi:hypothetical protein
MASVTITNDESKPEIVYEIIRIEDSEPVLDLLKRTFFKVRYVQHEIRMQKKNRKEN